MKLLLTLISVLLGVSVVVYGQTISESISTSSSSSSSSSTSTSSSSSYSDSSSSSSSSTNNGHPVCMPEGGDPSIYLSMAGIAMIGALYFRRRQHN